MRNKVEACAYDSALLTRLKSRKRRMWSISHPVAIEEVLRVERRVTVEEKQVQKSDKEINVAADRCRTRPRGGAVTVVSRL